MSLCCQCKAKRGKKAGTGVFGVVTHMLMDCDTKILKKKNVLDLFEHTHLFIAWIVLDT